MPLQDLQYKIEVLKSFDIQEHIIDIINQSSNILSDLLAQQLAIGKDGKGQNVTVFTRDYYKDRTIFNKEHFGSGLGRITEYITNYMTGAFYREMFVRTQGTNFYIESRVPYFEKIIAQSGEIIMELNDANLEFFSREIVVPEIQRRFSTLWNGI